MRKLISLSTEVPVIARPRLLAGTAVKPPYFAARQFDALYFPALPPPRTKRRNHTAHVHASPAGAGEGR